MKKEPETLLPVSQLRPTMTRWQYRKLVQAEQRKARQDQFRKIHDRVVVERKLKALAKRMRKSARARALA